jgi:hypothetical protein
MQTDPFPQDLRPTTSAKLLGYWFVVNALSPLASFISFFIAIFLTMTLALPETLSTAIYLSLAGLLVCIAQSTAIRLLPRVQRWVGISSLGLAFAPLATSLLLILELELSQEFRTPYFLIVFPLPVAIAQTIALFRARYRPYIWPFLGAAPFLLLPTMIFGTPISVLISALLGATLSTIAMWTTLAWSSHQQRDERARPD